MLRAQPLKVQKKLLSYKRVPENIYTVVAKISLENVPNKEPLLAEFILNTNLGNLQTIFLRVFDSFVGLELKALVSKDTLNKIRECTSDYPYYCLDCVFHNEVSYCH